MYAYVECLMVAHKSSFTTTCAIISISISISLIILCLMVCSSWHLFWVFGVGIGLGSGSGVFHLWLAAYYICFCCSPLLPALCRFMRHLSCESLYLSYFPGYAAAPMIFHFSMLARDKLSQQWMHQCLTKSWQRPSQIVWTATASVTL